MAAEAALDRLRHDDLRPDPILAVLDRRMLTLLLAGDGCDLAVDDLRDGEAPRRTIGLVAHLLLPHAEEAADEDGEEMRGAARLPRHDPGQRLHLVDVRRIVDAGAERIGTVLGDTATARDWASLIDHTLLKPEASESDIRKLCDEAAQFGFASVCVNPAWVRRAVEFLRSSGVPVCTVIGFPLGATRSDVKAYEARRAIFDGAREVDMVINVGALKSGDDCGVEEDIRAVVEAAHENGVLCKVIIETALLTNEEKVRA